MEKNNTIKRHSLNSSFIYVPDYYLHTGEKILKFDYFNMIINDIRNYKKLNEHQLNFIKNLDDDNKQIIIIELNNLIETIDYFCN
jgi:hypothetical protein